MNDRMPAAPAIPEIPEPAPKQEDQTVYREEDSSDSLTEWKAATAAVGLGIAGRAALQGIPSVETVTPLAIASGYYLGWKKGLYVGTAGFFISNFLVWGGQGPWTVFQILAAASAGIIGAGFSGIGKSRYAFFSSILAGTLAYETVINLGSVVYTPWAIGSPLPYFAAAVPFALIHLTSSVGFGGVLYGFDDSLERIGR